MRGALVFINSSTNQERGGLTVVAIFICGRISSLIVPKRNVTSSSLGHWNDHKKGGRVTRTFHMFPSVKSVGDSVSSPNLCTNDEVKSLACTNAWCVFAPCKRVDSSLNNSWPTPSHAVYVEPSNKSSISKRSPKRIGFTSR